MGPKPSRVFSSPIGHLALAVLLLGGAATVAAEPTRYVNTREVLIRFRAEPGEVDRVRVWCRDDARAEWLIAQTRRAGVDAVGWRPPNPGAYGVYLVLEGVNGVSGPAPLPDSPPQLTIMVDWTPPLLQLHEARVEQVGASRVLELSATVIEDHLSESGLRLRVKETGESQWRDVGPLRIINGVGRWPISPTIRAQRIDAQLVATDRAGNSAADALNAISIPLAAPKLDGAWLAADDVPTTHEASRNNAGDLDHEAASRLALLRADAESLARQMKFDQAEAKLRDALLISSDDPQTLVQMGELLLETKRYADAANAFSGAAKHETETPVALRGMALAALGQNEYPRAQELLGRLLAERPDSPEYLLRFGDVTYRLGGQADALAHWREVMRDEDPNAFEWAERARRRLDALDPRRLRERAGVDASWPNDRPTASPTDRSSSSTATRNTRSPSR